MPRDPAAARAGAFLTIDLDAIAANYGRLQRELGEIACGAVVKADAYGLGLAQVAPALAAAGARSFFVATAEEGVALRDILKSSYPGAMIFVLNGPMQGAEGDFLARRLTPVLNSLGDIELWRSFAAQGDRSLPAAIHVDTGMNRLGLTAAELDLVSDDHSRLEGLDLRLLMSHLACAEDPAHAMNGRQLAAFRAVRARLPRMAASLANSSGLFLGSGHHFDLGRPGVALYGVNPTPGRTNPMAPVVRLRARILQVRDIDAPQTVGYGATFRASGHMKIATVAVGYADGYMRSLSNRGMGYLDGIPVPVLGRVSMDLTIFDVSTVPAQAMRPDAMMDLIDPEGGVDVLADQAGTIGYEILTALGSRYHRTYLGT